MVLHDLIFDLKLLFEENHKPHDLPISKLQKKDL